MLTYSNQLKRLVLPEYGRNIQNMVDHCLTIEDRDERTACAHSVVEAMYTLFPPTGDPEEYRRKLWDHVLIMSDYKLDVDYPYEHVDPQVFADRPEPVEAMRPGSMPFRHYGRLIPQLIEAAVAMEEGEERDALILMIGNQMKKTLLASANDNAEDERVFADMRHLSHGAICVDPASMKLHEFKQAPTPSGKKKKKR